jgi:hypothetical protein
MTRNQRHWHARIWFALAFTLALGLGSALLRRGHTAASLASSGAGTTLPASTDRSAP